MHSWARHLVQEAQQQIRTSSAYHSPSSTHLDDHRDNDLQSSSDSAPLLTIPSSPTRARGNRVGGGSIPSPARFSSADSDVDGEEVDHPPAHQSIDKDSPPSLSASSSTAITRPFLHDKTLHSSIRNHVFRYSSALTSTSSPPFFPLTPDSSTLTFLTACTDHFYHSSRCSWYYLTHTVIKPLVSLCLSHTAVNGLLNTGHMFLLSSQQFLALYSFHTLSLRSSPPSPPSQSFGHLLDVGAGSGHITSHISPFFNSTTATEVSYMMTRRLTARHYHVYHTSTLTSLPPTSLFDCILCFNVLDRCSHPRTLLGELRERLRTESSLLFLATPLPLDPWVEVGKEWKAPEEGLGVEMGGGGCVGCMSWEEGVQRLSLLFINVGLAVLSVSRVPYISAGNAVKPFFTLDDALFVMSRVNPLLD